MKGASLIQTSYSVTGGESSCASVVTTGRNAGSYSCDRVMSMSVSCRSGISRSISQSLKGKAEQVGLNSRVLHCLAKARSIMRQKRRKAQQETTDHKDMAREDFARAFNPQVADRLRQILEENRRASQNHE